MLESSPTSAVLFLAAKETGCMAAGVWKLISNSQSVKKKKKDLSKPKQPRGISDAGYTMASNSDWSKAELVWELSSWSKSRKNRVDFWYSRPSEREDPDLVLPAEWTPVVWAVKTKI